MSTNIVGSSLAPSEDVRAVMGVGNYIDDVSPKNVSYCAFLRSPYAHAKIKSIDVSALKSNPKILGVYFAKDIDRIARPIKVDIPFPGIKPMYYHYLASKKVRWVGDAIVAVVATDRYSAEDALDSIKIEYEQLPAVVDPESALEPSAEVLYEEWGSNRFMNAKFSNGDVASAFKNADLVIEERMFVHRYAGVPMETRGCVAQYNQGTQTLTFWSSTQAPHVHKSLLAEALGLSENRVRVIAPDIGGGFGVKLNVYPEDVSVAALSILLRRPVKWIETRQEHFLASGHSRSQTHYVKLALSKDGTFRALSDRIVADLGALTYFPHNVFGTLMVTSSMLPGPYRIQNYHFEIDWVVTNKTPFGAYRGFGQPEATFVMERLVDLAAKQLRLDPVEIRRMNMIRKEEFPYVNATGTIYDSGSYVECLDKAAELVGYHDFKKSREHSSERRKYVGVGFACNTETTVPTIYGATRRWTAHDPVSVKIQPDGKVTVATGLASIGTSIETALCQIAAEEFGVGVQDVSVVLGDTDSTPYSSGNYGSRSAVVCGAALMGASKRIKEKMFKIASHLLEADNDDLTMEDGKFVSKANRNKSVTFKEIARIAYDETFRLPKGMESGLESTYFYEPPNIQNSPDKDGKINVSGTTTNATHAALVEVDPETGLIKVLKYVVVHDCGRVINPIIVNGQVHGGVAQSIGGTIYEELQYDKDGQPLSSSFIDYLLPTSLDVPNVDVAHFETPSPFMLGGFKGAGEAGTIGVPAAISNAVQNALSSFNIKIVETPIDPNRLWKLIKSQVVPS